MASLAKLGQAVYEVTIQVFSLPERLMRPHTSWGH
jgi:hypothetical protein